MYYVSEFAEQQMKRCLYTLYKIVRVTMCISLELHVNNMNFIKLQFLETLEYDIKTAPTCVYVLNA